MRLLVGEPDLGPWTARPAGDLVASLLRLRPAVRPLVVAVDGRSGAGKSTIARVLRDAADGLGERAVVLATDDVAWWQSRFDWDHLLADQVLSPVRSGEAVRWRPPAWIARGREGAIEVPAGTTLLFVEGVGAARQSLTPLLDVAVWVQSDTDSSYRRGIARDRTIHGRTSDTAKTFWDDWMTEEVPFLAADRPWLRADLVVAGTDVDVTHGPEDLVVAVRSKLLA